MSEQSRLDAARQDDPELSARVRAKREARLNPTPPPRRKTLAQVLAEEEAERAGQPVWVASPTAVGVPKLAPGRKRKKAKQQRLVGYVEVSVEAEPVKRQAGRRRMQQAPAWNVAPNEVSPDARFVAIYGSRGGMLTDSDRKLWPKPTTRIMDRDGQVLKHNERGEQ